MEWTPLIIGALTALGTVLSVHLIWREKNSSPFSSMKPFDRLGTQERKPLIVNLFLKHPIIPLQKNGAQITGNLTLGERVREGNNGKKFSSITEL